MFAWVRHVRAAPVVIACLATLAGCATSPVGGFGGAGSSVGGSGVGGPSGSRHIVQVAASISAWGSILSQLGGSHVQANSIITNPDTDPHDYEPTPQNATVIARSELFVENGVGYDSWAAKSLAASPSSGRKVIDVGALVHVGGSGNPHRWYSPSDVGAVADAITADLKKLDPGDAAYFDAQRQTFVTTGLARYDSLIQKIRSTYAGVPVGASESIFAPLAQALKLDLMTPAGFLKAISEGTDPSTSDLRSIHGQIAGKQIEVYVYNSQNATPDVRAQVQAAEAAGIPVATVTETLSPATATFQQWQSAQLAKLVAALHKATGR